MFECESIIMALSPCRLIRHWSRLRLTNLHYLHIPAVQFQICIQNRYKLNKKYRKLLPQTPDGELIEVSQWTPDQKTLMQQARVSPTLTLSTRLAHGHHECSPMDPWTNLNYNT